MISQDELKALWEYNNIGEVVWKTDTRGRKRGSLVDFGKSQISIGGQIYTLSKLRKLFTDNTTDTRTSITGIITYEQLIKVLEYAPDTGIFIWKEHRGANAPIGGIAGNLSPSGYWDIKVGGHSYRAHRLAWLYMTKAWPTDLIDHIDRDKLNNKFSNLRDVTRSLNALNSKLRIDNVSGTKGITITEDSTWVSQLTVDKINYYLGVFKTPEEAIEARQLKVKELGIIC